MGVYRCRPSALRRPLCQEMDQRAVSGRRGHGAVRLRHGFDHAEDAPAQSERFGRERQSPPLHGMGRPRGSTHLFR